MDYCDILNLAINICNTPRGNQVRIGKLEIKNDYPSQTEFVIGILTNLSIIYKANLATYNPRKSDSIYDIDVAVICGDINEKVSLMRLVYNLHICIIMQDGEEINTATQMKRDVHKYDPSFGLYLEEFNYVTNHKLLGVTAEGTSEPYGVMFKEELKVTSLQEFSTICHKYIEITRVRPIYFTFIFHTQDKNITGKNICSEELECSIQIMENIQEALYNSYFPPSCFIDSSQDFQQLQMLLNTETEVRYNKEYVKTQEHISASVIEVFTKILSNNYGVVVEDDGSIARFMICNFLSLNTTRNTNRSVEAPTDDKLNYNVYLEGLIYDEIQHYIDAYVCADSVISPALCNLIMANIVNQSITGSELYRHYNYGDILKCASKSKSKVIALSTTLTEPLSRVAMNLQKTISGAVTMRTDGNSYVQHVDEKNEEKEEEEDEDEENENATLRESMFNVSAKSGEKTKQKPNKISDHSLTHIYNYITATLIRSTRKGSKSIILVKSNARNIAAYMNIPLVTFTPMTDVKTSKKKEILDEYFDMGNAKIEGTMYKQTESKEKIFTQYNVISPEPVKFFNKDSIIFEK